ncbi:MAG: membrane protein insertion efficiency factor YidD [Parcubacteria group bacterium]|nr:membrane protein insertion efficiency factor YidD [Parcubacteria group bacterium]
MFSLNPTGMAGCRQIPSCSDYCVKAVSKLGLIKGLKMSFIRIINCR